MNTMEHREVAGMRQGWQTKTLGEICDIELGKTPARANASLWDEKRDTNNVWLSIADLLKAEDNVVIDSKEYVSDKGAAICKLVRQGTLLVSFKLTLGRLAFAGRDLFTNEAIAALTIVNERDLSKEFLYYCLTIFDWVKAAENDVKLKGMTLNKAKLKVMPISFPPLAEQQRIVAILDEAFADIATARANAVKNLENARALFESHLRTVFAQHDATGQERTSSETPATDRSPAVADDDEMALLHGGYVTRTGGREATSRHIPGPLSLAVGLPSSGARKGWRWSALTDLARLESGHTPSRRHPEYWGGVIPWIGIQDARKHHGDRIDETSQTINELGTANSSARLLPANTVCLSRTASVGYVVVMGRPMATSQDFVNWVCSASLLPDFLKYIFLAESRDGLLRYASGSVHQTIYFPEAKAFHIFHPDTKEQIRIIKQCDALSDETNRLTDIYTQKIAALDALKKSLLHQAFSGAL
jgi:restriction endonuclease S subunit